MAEDLLTITPDLNEQPKTPVVPTVAVDAPDTLVPAELQTDLDYSETHSSKVDNREAEMLRNRILSRAEQRKGKKEQDAPPGMTKENVASLFTDGPAGLEEFHTVGGGAAAQTRFRNVAADVGEGLVEAPGAVIGGAIDAVNSTIQLVDDLSAWVEKQFSDAPGKEELSEEERARREKKVAEGKVPAGVIREEGIDLTEAAPQLPNLPEPDTTTGQMTRAVAAFMTDFFLIGKAAPGLKAAKGAPLLTRIGKDAVRGALADFAGPVYEQRLSTLANQFPILGEIVPDYLAGDPNDTQLEKRFKNAIEGAGLGVVADGFITAVKAVRSSRIAKAKMQEAGLTPPAPKTAQNLEALGKAQDDILSTEVKVKPLGVEHPLEPTVDRLANIEQQIKVPPLYPRIERIATKDQVKEVVNQTIKDYPGEKRQLFRAVFEDDLKLKPGVLPANPKGHQTAKGENVVGTWWTTSLDDAVNTLKPGKEVRGGDRKVIIVAMDADSLPPQAYIQNATAADDMAFAWIGVPADVPTSQLKKVDISEDVAKIATKGEDDVTRGIAKDDVGRVGKAAGREGVSEPAAAGAGRAEESTAADIAAVAADGRDGGAVAFNPLDEAAPGEIRVNFSRIEAPEDVKQILQDMVDAKGATIQEARRGVRSWEETKLSADQLDAWKTLQERTPQGAFNAEQSVAVRELWVQSGSKLKEITDVAAAAPTEENLFLFRKMLATHQLIQKEAIAARTETARALNAWRIPAGGGAEQFRHIEGVLDQFGGKETSEQLLAKYKSLSDAGYERELVDFVEKSALAKSSDVVAQVWINSLLSSPHTHVRNIISQTAVLAQLVSERKAASVISEFRDATDGVVSGEAYQMVLGLVDGLKDSFRVTAKGRQLAKSATKKALDRDFAGAKEVLAESPEEFGTVLRSAATGETGIGIGKVELPREGALNAEALGIKNPGLSNVFDLLDTATQLPGRALAISDEFFKTSGYRMELRAQALRQATDEIEQGVIKQDALKDRMAQLINDPPEKLRLAASDTALAATFTGKPAELPYNIVKSIGKVPVLGRLVLPFRRTPVNIATHAFERTPLAPLVRKWREDVAAGGASKDLALAKFYTGNAMLLIAADLAMGGHVSGDGPLNKGQKENKVRQGWQPNSITVPIGKDGSRSFSYRGLEPISTLLGLGANMVEILENVEGDDPNAQLDEAIIAASMAIGAQVTSQNYMQGVSNFFDAMSDPRRYGEAFWQKAVGSAVPSGVAQIARTQDPYLRAASDLVDAVKRRTPGLSEDLPFVRDLWGGKIDVRSGLGPAYDIISPIYSREQDATPIDTELEDLEMWLRRPGKRSIFNGLVIDLDRFPKAYDRYMELAGNAQTHTVFGAPIDPMTNKGLKDTLNLLVTGKHPLSIIYNLTEEQTGGREHKMEMIRKQVRTYRSAARDQLLEEFPDLRAEVELRKRTQTGFIPVE